MSIRRINRRPLWRIPETGDKADWQGWGFELMDMDRKRVDKVLATPQASR
ncbi:transporter associated domain-containing protein [Pseudomonas lopnurensis]|nr:transporter associated domain-containing protein [Pseudomonas lopnurensis]MBE7374877.1 hypothetical protein [Pseudomonas lopnurensis]